MTPHNVRKKKYRMTDKARATERAYLEKPGVRAAKRASWRRKHGYPEPTRPEPHYCEVCGGRGKASVSLDHDHLTGMFRGWLCGNCNRALGLVDDNPATLRALADYLERAWRS